MSLATSLAGSSSSGLTTGYALRGWSVANHYELTPNPMSGITLGGIMAMCRVWQTIESADAPNVPVSTQGGGNGMAINFDVDTATGQHQDDLFLNGSVQDSAPTILAGAVDLGARVGKTYLMCIDIDASGASVVANYRVNYGFATVSAGVGGATPATTYLKVGQHQGVNPAEKMDIFGIGYWAGKQLTDAEWLAMLDATVAAGTITDPGSILDDYWTVPSTAPTGDWLSNGSVALTLTGSALTHVNVPIVWG